MKHIRIPFLVIALSLALTGMAFAKDVPGISSWVGNATFARTNPDGSVPGLTAGGVGGGGTGLGDVLLAPLYDVRTITNPDLPGAAGTALQTQDTLFCIVNTDAARGVVARLRFREWMRSHECLDLDIPLTTRDVWCGAVVNVNGTPYLTSTDRYVTNVVGIHPNSTAFTTAVVGTNPPTSGIAFRAYLVENQDITRCQYGYFEIIAEERVLWSTVTWDFTRLDDIAAPNRDVDNVLMGNVYIIRPDQKISHQYNMTAIQNFAVDTRGIYNPPTGDRPNLPNDVQGEFPGGLVPQNPGNGGFNNLEALLSKRYVNFQYVVGTAPLAEDPSQTPMSTSVVVTLPTKWVHYIRVPNHRIVAIDEWPGPTPFTGPCEALPDLCGVGTYGGEVYNYSLWDRTERAFGAPPTIPISPPPPAVPNIPILPYEVNILGLYPVYPAPTPPYFRNNSNIATQNTAVTPIQTFYSGWGFFDLSPLDLFVAGDPRPLPQPTIAATRRQGENVSFAMFSYFANFSFFNNLFTTYYGLPAIGIVMTEFYNDSNNGYYGNTVPWQYNVDWL